MARGRHLPQRTCVACRQVKGKSALVRVVRTPQGVVQLDLTGKVAGRGAYLCPDEACLNQAIKQKKLNRALGVAVEPRTAEEIRDRLLKARQREAYRVS